MDRTTLTANLKPLERRGWLPTLMKAGCTLLRSAVSIWERTHRDVDRVLTPPDASTFAAACGRCPETLRIAASLSGAAECAIRAGVRDEIR